MPHNFVTADVFTETAFGGNQLAVFPDARGISDRAMQAFAREINFAESTFVLPAVNPDHACRVRIFTPKTELPFAGHPTVGTAAVLAHLGKLQPHATVVFEEGIGPVSVELHPGKSPVFTRLVLEKCVERPSMAPSLGAAASTLSLTQETVCDAWYAGIGVPFSFIHLRDKEAVDRASLDRSAWSEHFARSWSPQLFLFCGDLAPGSRFYARMFAPALGVEEDPATGSAAAALAAALVERLPEDAGTFTCFIDQGVAMGRPSVIEASAEKRANRTVRVKVGGSTVLVGEGSITAPAGL